MQNPNLKISLKEANDYIEKQITDGQHLLSSKIKSRYEYNKILTDYDSWRDYSVVVLNKIFDSDHFAKEFLEYFVPPDSGDLYTEISSLYNDLKIDIDALKKIQNQLGLFDVLQEKKTNTEKNKLSTFFYNAYTVLILGGLVLAGILYLIEFLWTRRNNSKEIITSQIIEKPYFELNNYKIHAENKTYPTFDTLIVNYRYRGLVALLNKKFDLLSYEFFDDLIIYNDFENNYKPELEILETIVNNSLIDSINNHGVILIQLKRKMILKGFDLAYFNTEDKKIIGKLKLGVSYMINNKTYCDTLKSDIYIEKNTSHDSR